MKTIIVPTDFSDTAKKAQDFAVQSAKLFDSKITFLHSFELEKFYTSDYIGYEKDFAHQMAVSAEKSLDELKYEVSENGNVSVDTLLSSFGITEALLKVSEEKKADLIVMGTLGQSGFGERIWGSRTSDVIGRTKTPIMIVPHEYSWKKPSKILLLTNHFEKNPGILNFIFELAGLYMAAVEVGVFTNIDNEKAEKLLQNERDIAEYADYLKETYHEMNIKYTHLKGDDFEEVLHGYVEENEIDMLVMVTYQGGFWKRLFNPSFTKRMSYHTEIPLLAIPNE